MFKCIVANWTSLHTTPCCVIWEEIYTVAGRVDLRRTDCQTASIGIVNKFICLICAFNNASAGLFISKVNRGGRAHTNAGANAEIILSVCDPVLQASAVFYTSHRCCITIEIGKGRTSVNTSLSRWVFELAWARVTASLALPCGIISICIDGAR